MKINGKAEMNERERNIVQNGDDGQGDYLVDAKNKRKK